MGKVRDALNLKRAKRVSAIPTVNEQFGSSIFKNKLLITVTSQCLHLFLAFYKKNPSFFKNPAVTTSKAILLLSGLKGDSN